MKYFVTYTLISTVFRNKHVGTCFQGSFMLFTVLGPSSSRPEMNRHTNSKEGEPGDCKQEKNCACRGDLARATESRMDNIVLKPKPLLTEY